jgi:hypothetical protein
MGQDALGEHSRATRIRQQPARFKRTRPTAPGLCSLASEVVAEATYGECRPGSTVISLIARIVVIAIAALVILYVLKDFACVVFRTLTKPEDTQKREPRIVLGERLEPEATATACSPRLKHSPPGRPSRCHSQGLHRTASRVRATAS